MSAIRVCYLIDDLVMGGTEEHVLEVVRALDRTRVYPVVCCLQERGPIGAQIEALGVPLQVLGLGRLYGRGTVRAARRLAAFLGAHRIQILHTYLVSANLYGALVGRWIGIPRLVTTRRDMGFSRNWRLALLEQALVNPRADRIVAVCEAVRARTLRERGVRQDQVVTIHNGIEVPPLAAPARPGAPPMVLAAGALTPVKGHRYFLEAAARIARVRPDVTFAVAGDGPLRVEYEQWIAARGLHGRVVLLGMRTRAEVQRLLPEAAVVVLPSLSEGMSMVLLEAMAAGRPIVTTRVGGNPEVAGDGDTVVLVPPADPEALAAGITSVLHDPHRAAAMGAAARRRAGECFSLRRMVDRMEQLYDELMADARSVAA